MEAADTSSSTIEASMLSIHSVIRGHHVFKHIWIPYIGEILALQQEPGNEHDLFAVVLTVQPAAIIVGFVAVSCYRNGLFSAQISTRMHFPRVCGLSLVAI